LQEKNHQLNVLNMGGSGYGTDQMLITLEEEIKNYHPDLVIAAFINDDLKRAMIPFRDYKKPQFIFNNKQLVLTNTPIGDTKQTLQEISHKRYYSHNVIQTLNLLHYLISDVTLMEAEPDTTATDQLNIAIFEQMQKVSAENKADFMMVYLPNGDELASAKFQSTGETFFNNYIQTHQLTSLNPRSELFAAPFGKSGGHYTVNENTVLSDLVVKKIQALSSWQSKVSP